jgi:ABC-type spermidine/putrescine transport system permease subunit I
LLFVLAADFRQSLINKASSQGLLQLLVPCPFDTSFLVIQYADDTLIIMEGCVTQLETHKGILNTFTLATGLKVNFSKSMMVPINLTEEKLDLLSTGFTYLGLPLGTTKPKVELLFCHWFLNVREDYRPPLCS